MKNVWIWESLRVIFCTISGVFISLWWACSSLYHTILQENAAIVHNAPKNLYETPGNVESEKSAGTISHLSNDIENREIAYKGEKPQTNYEVPKKYETSSVKTNKVSTPSYQTRDTLYRIDLKNQLQDDKAAQHDVDYVVDTKAKTVTRTYKNVSNIYDPPTSLEDLRLSNKAHQQHAKKILSDLLKGTEQLLFSFVVPSTFCSTDNIMELQKLVTQGNISTFIYLFQSRWFIL